MTIIPEAGAARAACLWGRRHAPARHGMLIFGPGHRRIPDPRGLHPDVTGPVARGCRVPIPPILCKPSLGLGSSSSSTARSFACDHDSVVRAIVICPFVWEHFHAGGLSSAVPVAMNVTEQCLPTAMQVEFCSFASSTAAAAATRQISTCTAARAYLAFPDFVFNSFQNPKPISRFLW